MLFSHEAWVLFFALFALYSPLAALPSYLPVIRGFDHRQMVRLSIGLWFNAAAFVILAIWAGEYLLELLGISVAALTATGGIALGWEAVRLMLGKAGMIEELEPGLLERGEKPPSHPAADIQSVLFMPITFPLTVGGTTFAFGVAASADVGTARERLFLSIAAILYGAVTGITLYLSSRLERRISLRGALLADRLAGILLTAIAVILVANGFTDLVTSALHRLPAPVMARTVPPPRARRAAGNGSERRMSHGEVQVSCPAGERAARSCRDGCGAAQVGKDRQETCSARLARALGRGGSTARRT